MYSLKGKFVDFDNRWAYQCMDLAVDYVYHITNGKVRMWGNAKDSILNIFPKGWKIVKNTPDYVPPVGAIGVCTYGIYQRYGHIYLVWDNSGGTNTQTVLEQNFDGNADTPAKLRVDNFMEQHITSCHRLLMKIMMLIKLKQSRHVRLQINIMVNEYLKLSME